MQRLVIAAAAVAFLLPGSARAELVVSVSKSQQQAAVVVDGEEFYRWPVSTGTRGHETPVGSFRPARLERHWYSRQYSLTPMPWAMFFHRGYAMHGTMEAYNLGHAASHGCVRLRPDKAAILYSLMRHQGLANTKVVVMEGPPPPGARPIANTGSPGEEGAPPVTIAAEENSEHETAYAAKSHQAFAAVTSDESEEAPAPTKPARAGGVNYRVSVGSDERQILRERQAWLRSIDRKYGIAR